MNLVQKFDQWCWIEEIPLKQFWSQNWANHYLINLFALARALDHWLRITVLARLQVLILIWLTMQSIGCKLNKLFKFKLNNGRFWDIHTWETSLSSSTSTQWISISSPLSWILMIILTLEQGKSISSATPPPLFSSSVDHSPLYKRNITTVWRKSYYHLLTNTSTYYS